MKNKLTLLVILVFILSVVFAFSACGGNTDTNTNTETNTETGTQTESNTDTDTEDVPSSDTDTDSDTSVESDTNTATDSETDTRTEIESNTDTDSETDTETETNTDTDTDTETEPDEPEHVHTEEIIPAVEPTCTETGLTEGKKCSECGEILIEQTTIDALGHRYNGNYECTICDYVLPTSEGLEICLDSSTNTYMVCGVGTCTDSNIVIPSTYEGKAVTRIGGYAFDECKSLTSITIPNSVANIGGYAFYNCKGLINVNYLGNIEDWCNISFDSHPLRYGANLYLNGKLVTELVIPDTITEIKDYVFQGANFKRVIISDGVTSIGSGAFEYCEKVEEIIIPKSVMKIGRTSLPEQNTKSYQINYLGTLEEWFNIEIVGQLGCAFSGAILYIDEKPVKDLIIPKTITEIKQMSFSGMELTSVAFEENSVCKNIGNCAFYGCEDLTSVMLSDSVTSIEGEAFKGCKSLTTFTMSENIMSVGESVFSQTYKLSYNNYDAGEYLGNDENPYLVLIKASSEYINSCVINENTKIIGGGAFDDCRKLTSITIPKSVASIGERAFNYCTSLTSVILEEDSTCEIIGNYAFYGCKSLTSITIPNSVTNIGNLAFGYCTGLTNIEIPDSVTIIGVAAFSNTSLTYNEYDNACYLGNLQNPYLILIKAKDTNITSCIINENTKNIHHRAFQNCTSLTNINIPKNIENIGEQVFDSCKSLISIEIPDSVKNIGNWAFQNCTSLTSITIPDSVSSIGYNAFRDCTNLTSVTFENTNGWYVIGTEGATSGTDIIADDLANPEKASTYLKSTYADYYWYRK